MGIDGKWVASLISRNYYERIPRDISSEDSDRISVDFGKGILNPNHQPGTHPQTNVEELTIPGTNQWHFHLIWRHTKSGNFTVKSYCLED